MNIDSTGVRQRKGIAKLVEDLDIFDKVVENVKEEPKASSGLITFLCFSLILFLFCSETYRFLFVKQYDYRFTLDTNMEDMPTLDLDMIVATPCASLQVVSTMDQYSNGPFGVLQNSLNKNPTRFEFTDEEQLYWTILRHAHAQYNKQGLRALEQLEYIDDDVESTLENLADKKQEQESEIIMQKREMESKKGKSKENHAQVMFLVSNGMGMFQIVSDNSDKEEEGTACRIHGKFKVRKGKEEKIVISITNPMMMFDHFGPQPGNISHRIEKFNFGPRIPGLVTPLAGAEHISESGQDIYRYFIKVVPTKIHGFFSYTMAYQYSVTFLKKKLKDGEHSHGGILFEYEFNANVIEVHKNTMHFFTYLVRLCSIIGGVYATSHIINNMVQFLLSFLYPEDKLARVNHNHETRTAVSTDSHASLIINTDIRVH
ncbi:unnamed protein product [Caenorhabditis bovis]|uniref:Endoplasmic reticulum vesicle transporter C-terminal domain-containing protein n=1 Tax=Caenorhabditis bovis TaxID=2654633 RepID=A0A8S1E6K0_9PELO|nr:unnamed protein product [Caenorhabditis bovis]